MCEPNDFDSILSLASHFQRGRGSCDGSYIPLGQCSELVGGFSFLLARFVGHDATAPLAAPLEGSP